MRATQTRWTDLQAAAADAGLLALGAFRPLPGDGFAAGIVSVALIGNAGPAMWARFSSERRNQPDPLDAWTRRTVDGLGRRLGAQAIYPFDGPPYHPFQAWALRCAPVHASPIAALIHAEFGSWHAYRAALSFAHDLEAPLPVAAAGPCQGCPRPCLEACPVGAFDGDGDDVGACARHLRTRLGGDCLNGGCLARSACPVGREFIQPPAQASHHMRAFLAARDGD